MNTSRIMARAVAVTIGWFMFILNGYLFIDDEPPRANVVSSVFLEMTEAAGDARVVDLAETRDWDLSLEFMTAETFDRKLSAYRHDHRLRGILAVVFALVAIIFGGLLGRSWKWGVLSLLFGPVAAAYVGNRESKKALDGLEMSGKA